MILKPVEELQSEIRKIIIKEFDNSNLKEHINRRYIEKGFNPKDIALLFDEKKYIEELDEMKTICISKAMYEYYSNESLNPSKYYAIPTLEMYKNYIITSEEVNKIKIHNAIEISAEEYIGILTYKDIYDYMNASLICYTLNAQRQPTYKRLGSKYIAVPTIDSKAVNDIARTVIKGDLQSTQIILSYIVDNTNIPKIKFAPRLDNIGDLTIEEVLSCVDGYHRLSGINLGVTRHLAETGEFLEGYITCKILISDLAKARLNVTQSFKRATTSEQYLRSITDDDKSNFLDKVINNSKILKNNVALTYEECKALNKLTYRTIMLDMLDKINIDYSNTAECLIKSKQIAETYDIISDFIKTDSINLRGIFLYLAHRIIEKHKDDIEIYYKIAEAIEDITETQKTEWKLDLKTVKINQILQYFNELFKEE